MMESGKDQNCENYKKVEMPAINFTWSSINSILNIKPWLISGK